MRLVLPLFAILLALPAAAADWLLSNDSTRIVSGLRPGQFATYTPTAVGDDSGLLDVGGCENADILYFNDTDGDATAGTVTIVLRQCPQGISADADACWGIEGVTLSGTDPNEAIYGVKATSVYADVGGTENDGDTQQLEVWCNNKASD